LTPLGTITLKVNLDNLETDQGFTVVENLSASAILGCDFLKREGIVIDFQNNIFSSHQIPTLKGQLNPHQASVCTLVLDNDYPQAIPYPATTLKPELDMPTDYHPSLKLLLKEHSTIFCKTLGKSLTQVILSQLKYLVQFPFILQTVYTSSYRRWLMRELSDLATVYGVPMQSMSPKPMGKSESV